MRIIWYYLGKIFALEKSIFDVKKMSTDEKVQKFALGVQI